MSFSSNGERQDIITKLGISLEELDSSDNLLPVIGRLALRLSQTEQALEETVDALIEIQEEKLKQERQTPDLEATKRQLYETQEANHQLQERLDVLNKEREWLRAAKEYDESGISPLPPPPSKQREFRRRKSETAIATIRRAPPSSSKILLRCITPGSYFTAERDEIKRLIQKSIKQDISRRQQHLF